MNPKYLVVDLDGSLICTDLMWESLVLILFSKPWLLFALPIWLCRGRAHCKSQLFRHSRMDYTALPYRKAVLDLIHDAKKNGQLVILATASYSKLALGVANQVKLFDHVLSSSETTNLKGSAKLREVLSYCNGGKFNYVGDARADRALWHAAETAYVVNAPREARRLKVDNNDVLRIDDRARWWRELATAMRLKQWVKNGLIFVPALLAGQLFTSLHWGNLVTAFVLFGLVASGMYLANDLMDLEDDRRHRSKRNRPFASGRLDLRWGVVFAPLLVIAGLVGAYVFTPVHFFWTIVLYLCLNVAYNTYLKQVLMADVVALASLYTIRVFAGGAAIGVDVSQWLLGFSVFIFLSLALAKRVTELLYKQSANEQPASRRDYQLADIGTLSYLGSASGFVSALVLALYISSSSVLVHYQLPQVLWLVCLVLLFWICRLWVLVSRGSMTDDPIDFSLQDRVTWISGLLVMGLILFSMNGFPGG